MTLVPRSRVALFVGGLLCGCLLALGGACAAAEADPLDWPTWRGPEQNGISRETGLVEEWDYESEDNLLWKSEALGSRSNPIVMNGRLYTVVPDRPDTPQQGEKVVCVDPATGEVQWEYRINVYSTDVPVERVGWGGCTGDPATGNVYVMGVCGYFACLNGETGEKIWDRSLSEEFGLLTTYGGRTNTPVVFENLVIISGVMINWGNTDPNWKYQVFDKGIGGWGDMAKPCHRFMAMNKASGEVVWLNGTRMLPDDTTYSMPTLCVLGGQAALVTGSGDGAVYAFQPRTGNIIWKYQLSLRGLNVAPLVVGDTVYMGQSEENRDDNTMGALVAINGLGSGDVTKTHELWRRKEVMIGKSSMLYVDGRLYGVDDGGGFWVFDAATGEQIGAEEGETPRANEKLGSAMRASLTYAGGLIFAAEMNGRWSILAPTGEGVEIVHELRLPDGEECHGTPIVWHGRIYLPSTGAMYCIGNADQETGADPRPASPQESKVADDKTPAHLQVVPADVVLQPGKSQQFTVNAFNARGQLLKKNVKATFAVDAAGEIGKKGLFTAESLPEHRAALVKATYEGLDAFARIRIVPPLPWKFDFDDGQVPITWVGIRYRHVIREVDGSPVMVKVTTIPKGTRSQGWFGIPNLSNYTIQADVKGAATDNKMPDIGLIGQRYTLDLGGAHQQLQLRSWLAEVRRRATTTMSFPWQPNEWYTMKLRCAVEDDRAVLRGKVWPRDEREPKEWTIELIDDAPNTTGSPGLFGNASFAELFLDNITVTPNE